jgi:hypothetical protein
MPDSRPPTISTVFRNLHALVADSAPRSAAFLLGCRWSFALPQPAVREELTEYTLPSGPDHYPAAIARRTGLRIVEHANDEPVELGDHLAAGTAAVVAVDCFHLRHRPAFGRVHSARTLLVRPGRHAGEAQVDDAWDPTYLGPVPWPELQRARHSDVPLDPVREPVFAGRPVGGEWISVCYAPTLVRDPAGWGAELLRELCDEATSSSTDDRGQYGIEAILTLARECEHLRDGAPEDRFSWARQASLLLRAELSSRVFLQALLQAVAYWTSDLTLRTAAGDYSRGLHALEAARDLLVKSLHRPDLGCLGWAAEQIRSAWGAESRLVEQVRRATQKLDYPYSASTPPIDAKGPAS